MYTFIIMKKKTENFITILLKATLLIFLFFQKNFKTHIKIIQGSN